MKPKKKLPNLKPKQPLEPKPVPQYRLYAAAFICGMCVMILELVGSRMVAPFLGTSIVVWTALIGVIMASLAAGYYAGGRIADARPSAAVLSALIAGAALWVVLLAFAQRAVLGALLSSGIENIYVLAVAAALIFFAAPGFLLAAVSPFVVRLYSDGGGKIGGIAGRVSAFSTMGGIAGTFLGGFVLVSFFSVTVILLLTALVLFIASALTWFKTVPGTVLGVLALVFGRGVYSPTIETLYNSLIVSEGIENGRAVRALYTDSGKVQGRMYVDSPGEMAADYLKFIAGNFLGDTVQTALVMGGGIYTLPRYLAASVTAVDVVEIDPGITQAARDFFHLADSPNRRIFHEDARYFVNRTALAGTARYDFILQDTYGSLFNVPFQLTSAEYMGTVKTLLTGNGVFIINFMGSLDSAMFASLYATFLAVFPEVKVFLINEPDDTKTLQNILLAASKSGILPSGLPEYRGAIPKAAVFTDGFAPVEWKTMEMTGRQ